MATNAPQETPPTPAPPTEGPIPAYTASGVPVNRVYRFAFQLWVIFFLLTIVITLIFYLYDKTRLTLGR